MLCTIHKSSFIICMSHMEEIHFIYRFSGLCFQSVVGSLVMYPYGCRGHALLLRHWRRQRLHWPPCLTSNSWQATTSTTEACRKLQDEEEMLFFLNNIFLYKNTKHWEDETTGHRIRGIPPNTYALVYSLQGILMLTVVTESNSLVVWANISFCFLMNICFPSPFLSAEEGQHPDPWNMTPSPVSFLPS